MNAINNNTRPSFNGRYIVKGSKADVKKVYDCLNFAFNEKIRYKSRNYDFWGNEIWYTFETPRTEKSFYACEHYNLIPTPLNNSEYLEMLVGTNQHAKKVSSARAKEGLGVLERSFDYDLLTIVADDFGINETRSKYENIKKENVDTISNFKIELWEEARKKLTEIYGEKAQDIKVLDAKEVLNAIFEHKFNFKLGRIIKNKTDKFLSLLDYKDWT